MPHSVTVGTMQLIVIIIWAPVHQRIVRGLTLHKMKDTSAHDAQRDWNLDRFPPLSEGDNSCPRANTHTPEYCSGYQIGYTDSWNAHLNLSTSTSNSTAPPSSHATSMPPPSILTDIWPGYYVIQLFVLVF